MFDKINYDRLVEITETEPHFRHKKGHKTKCYPWGENRGQNNKYFTENERCSYFDIHYAHKERVLLRVHKGNLVECMRSHYDQGDIMVLMKVIGKQVKWTLLDKTITSDIIRKEEISVGGLRDYDEDRYVIKLNVEFLGGIYETEFT